MSFSAGFLVGAIFSGVLSCLSIYFWRSLSIGSSVSATIPTMLSGKRKNKLKPKHHSDEELAAREEKRPPTMHEWGD